MFHYSMQTPKTVEKAVQALEGTLKEEGFGVLWNFDLQGTLQNKGVDFSSEYKILEVCNPKEAEKVLTEDKLVGNFLPCKVIVFEENSQTTISMPKPTVLIGHMENQQLLDIAEDIEQRMKTCIDKAV
ncbi:Uncharacterized conserved protein, DUF302 family [Alteribacillus persepolensis]|uniref:Uncharacterized conserved protein, DUF302 family n=1 Tax=Alteribacillus persepolensis TaxID=568899 RepID=A0A1G8JZM7_9BACI|nr:DUF302 domain-containing protein [Alteribacillus persepolensis]SDI36593.1 Uncharacterized conserved protein, DUF302 family [Alteribacillus persepolensis]